ncbi:MAG: class I SAM-dependent methyltransferase [Actinomycetota bacterium]
MDADDVGEHAGLSDISRDSGDVARYYDDWADSYDRTLAEWRYELPDRVAEQLASWLDPRSAVLDAGCGTGLTGRALRAAGFGTIDGIDVSPRSIEASAAHGAYRQLTEVDMQRTPFPLDADRYDGLVCVGVLTYLPDTMATLTEFARLVRPGGTVIVTQRTDLFDERRFPEHLAALAADGALGEVTIGEPEPYLPGNAEFGEELLVRRIAYRV